MQHSKKFLRKPSFTQKHMMSWWSLEHPRRILPVLAMAVPAVGGLLILLFFVSIKYIPEFDLSGSIALLWAVAVVGFLIVLGIGLGAMLPSFLEFVSEREKTTYNQRAHQQLWCSLPGWVTMLFFLLQSVGWVHNSMIEWSTSRVTFILACMSLIVGGLLARKVTGAGIAASGTSPTKNWVHGTSTGLFLAAACWVWAMTFGLTSIFLLSMGNSDASSPVSLVSVTFAWLVLVMGINAQGIRIGTLKPLVAGAALAIAVFLSFLVALGNLSGFAVGILRALQQTDVPVRLVVTGDGCEVLNKAVRSSTVCKIQSGEKFAVVCPVILQSKIGSPFLVEFAPLASSGHWPATEGRQPVPIPREFVSSWPRLDLKKSNVAHPVDVNANASTLLSWIAASNSTEKEWLSRACGTAP